MKARLGIAALLAVAGCSRPATEFRIGYEMNLASAPALLGLAREDFQNELALPVRSMAFNAGPGTADALFADKVDFAYMDPVAAIGAFVRSKGKFVIVAGSALGGAGLVVAPDTAKTGVDSLRETRVATPQVGSASDVSARHFFLQKGFVSREQGGGFQIVPIANLDVGRVFERQDVAGVWTTEPWLSALETESGGVLLVSEAEQMEPPGVLSDPTGVVVARLDLIKRNPALLTAFLRVHAALVSDLNENRSDSRDLCQKQLAAACGREFDPRTMARAWPRMSFSAGTPADAIVRRGYEAFRVGFMGPEMPDLRRAFHDPPQPDRAAAAR